jgi:hypothetical protein
MSFKILQRGVVGTVWIRGWDGVVLGSHEGGIVLDGDDDRFPFPIPPHSIVIDTSQAGGRAIFNSDAFINGLVAEIATHEGHMVELDREQAERWGYLGRAER